MTAMKQTLTDMETAIPGLYASAPHPLPFAPSLHIRAFVLRREPGNLLVYAAPTVEAHADAIEAMGGISRQYLNHWHEASFGGDSVAVTFKAPLLCHANEREPVADHLTVGDTFSERAMLDGDFELIPTPGHTSGATAYRWDTGRHRLLFTGDTIYLSDGEWRAAVLPGSSDRDLYTASLELIRELDFDVLVPWAATAGQPCLAITDPADRRRRIDEILDRVRHGADH
jgi:glyoxylase-like metal-dependent hydrolase (beta-lactamase superfamily II)